MLDLIAYPACFALGAVAVYAFMHFGGWIATTTTYRVNIPPCKKCGHTPAPYEETIRR